MTVERDKWYDVERQNRTYWFPDGTIIEIKNIVRFKLSESGNHYLDTGDDESYIVAPKWLLFKIHWMEGGTWTVN